MKNYSHITRLAVPALALILIACGAPETHVGARSSEQESKAAPVATNEASADADVAQRNVQPSGTGAVISDYYPRPDEVARSLAPEHRQLRQALNDGEWQRVLDLAASIQALEETAGVRGTPFSLEQAEAHIGLGRPQEAILLIDPDPNHRDTDRNLTLALALAMTGELDAAAAREALLGTLHFIDGPKEGFLPRPITRDQIIATVRTARAVWAGSSQPEQYTIREAKEALRLDPNQHLAAFVLANALKTQQRSAEALPYWQQASALPGSLGEKARRMVTSTEAALRQRAQSAQSGQGAGGGSQ